VRSPLLLLVLGAAGCIAERGPLTNRMAQSATTYLTRAARQPVKWQPWGRDAFVLAAKLDRPVLLYVGGEACRWCAETDRAIYTDPEIGTLINALFVPIRVDRDERPDVAQRYQTAVERLAGLHGWPLTVFLTADGAPFFGGTYFPADDPVTGRGLKQLLPEVARSYHEQRSVIVQHAALVRQLMLTGNGASRGVLRPGSIESAIAEVRGELDDAVRSHGAVGSVMHAAAVSLLLTEYARSRDSVSLAVARRALYLMLDTVAAIGGEDPPRLVRAALAGVFAQAWVVTGEEQFREYGRALVRAVARDLRWGSAQGESTGERAVFVDQEAYVIEAALLAGATLGENGAEDRAQAALDGLLQRAYARGWGVRHSVGGFPGTVATTSHGLLQDQVQVASACLAAHQLTGERRYLDVALDIVTLLDHAYADSLGGFYDTAAPAPPAIPDVATPALADRSKRAFDDMLPGPNAVAARVFTRLAEVTNDPSYRRRAEATLEAFAGGIPASGLRAATFLSAARETLAIP
jgi:uncharacterized protein YyaL (SSP411 family)